MKRPYIICHMTESIDGKVTGDFLSLPECEKAIEVYYEINRCYKGDAFACGRVTMEESFTGGYYPDLSPFEGVTDREDHIADKDAKFFAVAFDRKGRLGFKTPRIIDEDPGYGDAHIVEVLCEEADDRYLGYLRHIGISYIFAGEKDIDLSVALDKLKRLFGIKKLLLEGGSILNGAFEKEGLIDELSLVIAPVIADKEDKPLFAEGGSMKFSLTDSKTYDDGVLWTRYLAK